MEEQIIVGGGIAGSVAATVLARAGHSPLLVERSSAAHHKVCGEFLSWEAADRLAGLGLDVPSLCGVRIARVRLIGGRQSAEATLPRVATGISRFRLDEALLAHAARAGARIERGVAVRSATTRGDEIALEVGGGVIEARTLILATGKRELRGVSRDLNGQNAIADLVAFKVHYRLTPRQSGVLDEVVELHLIPGGYAGLQLIEDGVANLCLLIPRETVTKCQGDWDRILTGIVSEAPVLGDRLDGSEMLFDKPLTVSGVPYGFVHRPTSDLPRVVRIGDQFAVVHSFTGDGMALAVEGGRLAGALAGMSRVDPMRIHARLQTGVERPIRISSAMYRFLRHPAARSLAVPIARIFPQLLATAARLTRVRE